VSSTRLTTTISAADLTTAGTAQVSVVTPEPGGGTSAAKSFSVRNPIPLATALTPRILTRGGPAFTLTVTGRGFVNGSVVSPPPGGGTSNSRAFTVSRFPVP
jgi:hypothetical protein